MTKLQIATVSAKRTQEASQGSQAPAIEKVDLLKLQDEFLRFESVLFAFSLQGLGFFAGDNPSATANHHHIAAKLTLQVQLHQGTVRSAAW